MRTVYHVTYETTAEEWRVKKENAERSSANFETKEKATEEAKRLAKNNEPSQVIVHNMNGVISDEWTYGGDPNPPKG